MSYPTFTYANGVIPFVGAKAEKKENKTHIVKHEIIARTEIVQWMGYSSPTITLQGFFTGSDCIVQREALESVWFNGITGSLSLSGDLSGSYQVYLEELSPSLKGGYWQSYIGQGYLPYSLKFACITFMGV